MVLIFTWKKKLDTVIRSLLQLLADAFHVATALYMQKDPLCWLQLGASQDVSL